MPYFEDNKKQYKISGSMCHTTLDIIVKESELNKAIKELQKIQKKLKLKENERAFLTFDEYSCNLGIVIGKED